MDLQTVFHILGALVAIGLPATLVWWLTRRLTTRVYCRIVLIPLSVFMLAGPILSGLLSPLDEGRWRCVVCAAQEYRTSYAGILLRRPSWDRPGDPRDSSSFERWYWEEIGRVHPHAWIRVGCHWQGLGKIACYEFPGQTYYVALPRLPDPSVAASMALRVLHASEQDRNRMIRTLDEDPFHSIALDEPMSRDEFLTRHAAWLDRHPEWR